MTDTTHEALNLAEGIGELMEGHEFKAIMLALGNVIAELLTQATDGPEEAAKVLTALSASIQESVEKQLPSPNSKLPVQKLRKGSLIMKRPFRWQLRWQFPFCCLKKWSERGDLNSRPPVPQTGALTELRYAPI